MSASSVDARFFEALYTRSPDPWGYQTSAYERDKYAHTLNSIPFRSYSRALEMGCSGGVFTRMLAPRCRALTAVDYSVAAVERARAQTADLVNVQIEHLDLRAELPPGPFDLIVCSELLYYWEAREVERAVTRIQAALADGGVLVAVHWTGHDPDAPLDGLKVHQLVRDSIGLACTARERRSHYVLERYEVAR